MRHARVVLSLSVQEWNALNLVAREEGLSMPSFVRGLVIDFLVEEKGCHFVQRIRKAGRPRSRETSEARRGRASGGDAWDYVAPGREAMDSREAGLSSHLQPELLAGCVGDGVRGGGEEPRSPASE